MGPWDKQNWEGYCGQSALWTFSGLVRMRSLVAESIGQIRSIHELRSYVTSYVRLTLVAIAMAKQAKHFLKNVLSHNNV